MATAAVQERAKRVKFFQNGDRSVKKDICINKKVIRTWDALLEELTGRLKLHVPARSIRTPVGGTRISDISGLEDNNEYVVVGNGPFRKAGYKDPLPARRPGMSPRMLMEIRPVEHNKNLRVSAKIHKLPNQVKTLHAFANGKKLDEGKRLAFGDKALKEWRVLMETLTEKLQMEKACVKLYHYTPDKYTLVTSPEQLQTNEKYICVGAGERLKKHEYGRIAPPKFNSSKHVKKHELAPIKRSRRPHPEGGESYNTTSESSPISTSTAKTNSTKKSVSKRSTSKLKKEEDGVFHARPVKHTPSAGGAPVRDDEDFYAAKAREGDTAEVVEETNDTQVELPIDQVEAEVVEDEDDIEDDEDDVRISSGQNLTKKPSDDIPDEIETPLKSHISPESHSDSIVLDDSELDSSNHFMFRSSQDEENETPPPAKILISPMTKKAERRKKEQLQKFA